jgi:hypothetical protein
MNIDVPYSLENLPPLTALERFMKEEGFTLSAVCLADPGERIRLNLKARYYVETTFGITRVWTSRSLAVAQPQHSLPPVPNDGMRTAVPNTASSFAQRTEGTDDRSTTIPSAPPDDISVTHSTIPIQSDVDSIVQSVRALTDSGMLPPPIEPPANTAIDLQTPTRPPEASTESISDL